MGVGGEGVRREGSAALTRPGVGGGVGAGLDQGQICWVEVGLRLRNSQSHGHAHLGSCVVWDPGPEPNPGSAAESSNQKVLSFSSINWVPRLYVKDPRKSLRTVHVFSAVCVSLVKGGVGIC